METKVIENKSVIVIEQANPQVVYVPSYNPVVVYGPPIYPYPPIYYPPVGLLRRGHGDFFRRWRGDGSVLGRRVGWGCGWGGNNIYINNNNNFNRNTNINGGNRAYGNGYRSSAAVGNRRRRRGATGQHNPEHRGGTPYRDRATADRFGGSARGDSLSQRQSQRPATIGRQGGQSAQQSVPAAGELVGVSNRAGEQLAPAIAAAGGLRQPGWRAGRSRPHRQPGSLAQRWRKPGCIRRRFQGIQRIERAGSSSRGSSSMQSRGGGGGFSRGGGGGAAQVGGRDRGKEIRGAPT